MESKAQAAQQKSKKDEEPWVEDSGPEWKEEHGEQEPAQEETTAVKEEKEPTGEKNNCSSGRGSSGGQRDVFVNGLYVGLGIGCIATFITMWLAVFFSPQLPPGSTYQTMLSIFIYPLIYLLAVGLIALTAGIVREYYVPKINR